MAIRGYLFSALALSWFAVQAHAAPTVDEIYNIRMTGEGSCAKYHGLGGNGQLEKMFNDMQKVLHEANTAVGGDYKNDWTAKTRGLAKSFFGLHGVADDKSVNTPATDTLDGKILAKMKGKDTPAHWLRKD